MGLSLSACLLPATAIYASRTEATPKLITEAVQQVKKVNGTVVDPTGMPIIGATVLEKNNPSNGTITDIDGKFNFSVKPDAIISISYIGYTTQNIRVGNQAYLKITLKEDSKTLDEVVVIGFGAQKKESLTGAVSQVKMDDVLGSRPVVNAMTALQGTMPGLQITPNGDASGPGQTKSFNIRGTTSINGGGPLVLIDNVPGDIDMLNPEDIESVSVLKDASSSAIYGARAAFGVILVTTKKGKKGEKFHLNYNNNFGFQKSVNRPEQADGLQWMQAYLDGEFNAGKYFTGQDMHKWMEYLTEYRENPGNFQTTGDGIYVDPESGLNYYLNEKNIYTNLFDDFGFLQTHNASLSGGTELLTYRMSVGYSDEQGILATDKDRYKRLSGSAYISAEVTPWLTQSVDIRYAQSNKNMPVTSDHTGLYDMRLPVVYPEGTLTLPDGTVLPTNTPYNILQLATDNNTITDNARILSKTTLKPLKGLEMSSRSAPLRELSPLRTVRASFPAYGSSNMTVIGFDADKAISFTTFMLINLLFNYTFATGMYKCPHFSSIDNLLGNAPRSFTVYTFSTNRAYFILSFPNVY